MRKVIAPNDLPSREELLSWIHALCAGDHRLAGTAEGRRAEKVVEGWFRDVGIEEVTRDPIALQSWIPDAGRLEYGGSAPEVYPVARSRFSGPGGVHGPLVYLGQGDPENLDGRSLEGKIAVVDVPFGPRPYQHLRKTAYAVHDPEGTFARDLDTRANWILPTLARAYAWCAARGAAGWIGILRDLGCGHCRYHYPYGNEREVLPVPAAFLGSEEGDQLREMLRQRLAEGRPVEGRLITTGKAAAAETSNIIGLLPGVSDRLILATTHHDSPFRGFVDDASGLAVLLTIARHFARKPPDQRPCSMAFLASAGNFVNHLGARDFLARHAHDLVPRLALVVTLEHIGREVAREAGKLIPTGQIEPRGVFVSDQPDLLDIATLPIVANDLRRTFVAPVPQEGGHVDGEARRYFAAGLPTIGLIGGPGYVLTADDGPDLLAVDDLVPTAKAFIEIIEAFMEAI